MVNFKASLQPSCGAGWRYFSKRSCRVVHHLPRPAAAHQHRPAVPTAPPERGGTQTTPQRVRYSVTGDVCVCVCVHPQAPNLYRIPVEKDAERTRGD